MSENPNNTDKLEAFAAGQAEQAGYSHYEQYHPSMTPGTGAPQVVYIHNQQPRVSGWMVFVLCGFFGFLGVHRFYLGQIGMGFLYLFTFGLFGIGAIVDLFLAWWLAKNVNQSRGYGRVSK